MGGSGNQAGFLMLFLNSTALASCKQALATLNKWEPGPGTELQVGTQRPESLAGGSGKRNPRGTPAAPIPSGPLARPSLQGPNGRSQESAAKVGAGRFQTT